MSWFEPKTYPNAFSRQNSLLKCLSLKFDFNLAENKHRPKPSGDPATESAERAQIVG
ncbi:MAG: hypothetical protein QXQ66_06330 [Candidatus Hadarchaeum sp.]